MASTAKTSVSRAGGRFGDFVRFTRESLALHYGIDQPEAVVAAKLALGDADAFLTIEDGGIVAGAAAYSFDMTVRPQRSSTVSGIGDIGVLPSHRRRGHLTTLVREHLRDAAGRDRAAAVLHASEGGIYGRYGYAPVTTDVTWVLDVRAARLRGDRPDGTVELVDEAAAADLLPVVFAAYQGDTVGELVRTPDWWTARWRQSAAVGIAGALSHVVYRRDGAVHGYAAWRRSSPWSPQTGPGAVIVEELVTLDPQADRALLHFFMNLDLCAQVVFRARPYQEPLRWHLADVRSLGLGHHVDRLWFRVLDTATLVRTCLPHLDQAVTILVHDPMDLAGGRFDVVPDAAGARCVTSKRAADLELGVAELSQLVLGSAVAAELVRAGRVTEHRAGATFALARGPGPAPHCSTAF